MVERSEGRAPARGHSRRRCRRLSTAYGVEDDAGRLARLAGLAHAMCDVSDEFVTDLGHSCDRCIAEDLDFVPRLAPAGDDYEMVFTSPTAASSPIECLSPELGLPVTASGWQYF